MIRGNNWSVALTGLAIATLFFHSAFSQVVEHERRIDALHAKIQAGMEEIESAKEVIQHLAKQDKELRTANLSTAEVRRDLSEARAELKSDKKEVKNYIKALDQEYNLAIEERKENLKQARTAKVSYREKLELSLDKGDAEKSADYAAWVARYTAKIKKDQHALRNAESNRDASMLSVNRKLKHCSTKQTKVSLDYSEHAATGYKNINFNRLSK